jgi:hypothetical protein
MHATWKHWCKSIVASAMPWSAKFGLHGFRKHGHATSLLPFLLLTQAALVNLSFPPLNGIL